ncbi:unnamed protein product [Hermetia illucens]|uniref:Uncharacterized protein n=1 Tax=Hermetia illucens TaxID=343691 RepID=A0A7R8YUW7_HERIL|nr:unnamed protein product [Hermetia illucens]
MFTTHRQDMRNGLQDESPWPSRIQTAAPLPTRSTFEKADSESVTCPGSICDPYMLPYSTFYYPAGPYGPRICLCPYVPLHQMSPLPRP